MRSHSSFGESPVLTHKRSSKTVAISSVSLPEAYLRPKTAWLSMRKTAPHGAPRRDIRSPWRQLLSIPIPCHVHWQRSYCQSPAHMPAICGKPCFRGPSGCMRGAGAFGPLLRAGCAGAAWVRHGNLGSGMRAGRRCLAPRVGSVRWAGSLRATRARALVALAGA